MFDRKGYIVINNESGELDEDVITLEALEAGADDISNEDSAYEIYTSTESYQEVLDYFTEKISTFLIMKLL